MIFLILCGPFSLSLLIACHLSDPLELKLYRLPVAALDPMRRGVALVLGDLSGRRERHSAIEFDKLYGPCDLLAQVEGRSRELPVEDDHLFWEAWNWNGHYLVILFLPRPARVANGFVHGRYFTQKRLSRAYAGMVCFPIQPVLLLVELIYLFDKCVEFVHFL